MLIMLYSCIVWSLQSGSFHQSQAFPKILSLVSGCGASKRGWVWSCRASKQRWNHWLLSTTAQWSCVKQCQLHGRSAECIYSYHPMLWSLWWDVSVGVTHPCCSSISLQKHLSRGLAQLPDAPCLSTVGSFDQFVANKSCSQTLKSFNQLKTRKCQSFRIFMTYMTYMTYVIMYTCIHDATWQHWTSHISIYFMHQDLVLPQWDSSRPSIQSGPPRSHEHRSRWYPK